jgi:hypothetical protein
MRWGDVVCAENMLLVPNRGGELRYCKQLFKCTGKLGFESPSPSLTSSSFCVGMLVHTHEKRPLSLSERSSNNPVAFLRFAERE